MTTKEQYDDYEKDNAFRTYNHIDICHVDKESATVKVDLSENSMNLQGFVHGGLIFSLADCAAGLLARTDGRFYVTQSMHINFLRNVREGTVYGKGNIIKRGGKMTIIQIDITSEDGLLLAQATASMFCTD